MWGVEGEDSEIPTVTYTVVKTDFNSICFCVAFDDSSVKRFLGMFLL